MARERFDGAIMKDIRYLRHSEIDKEAWDRCVTRSVFPRVYGLSFYLDIVCPGWNALIADDYQSVFPLPIKKKLGLPYVYHPLFAQQLGVFSDQRDEEILHRFFEAIPKTFLKIQVQLPDFQMTEVKGFSKKRNFILPLNESDPIHGYNENTKRNIKKALKFGLVIKGIPWKASFQLKRETSVTRLSAGEWKTLSLLMESLENRNMSESLGVYDGSDLIAAVYFVHWQDRIYYLVSSSTETGKHKRASFLIVDHVIRKYAGTLKILDFEGSMDENIAFFFKGFGAMQEDYLSYQKGPLG